MNNTLARRLFLHRHALAEAPSGPSKGDDLLALIRRLGFVQIDSVNTVERAHHMILFARRPSYRPAHLTPLLERERSLFEHWTHDASIIPTEFYPHWHLRFERAADRLAERWKSWQRHGFEEQFDTVLTQIREGGACCSSDVGQGEKKGSTGWWDWHPSKTALEYLWRVGDLAVTHRAGFQKFYDLSERVLPDGVLRDRPGAVDTVEWCCNAAIDRLGFATSGEVAAFWATATSAEAKAWCGQELRRGTLIEVDIEGHDGALRRCFARPTVVADAEAAPVPTGRLRVLSPFDPALRDRRRAERLFGFYYRIEIFVPEAKRQYGYYVFPLLEGDRLIGRIDMRANRANRVLEVAALWPEAGVKLSGGRLARLEAELGRIARFAGCDTVSYGEGWLRASP